MFLATLNIFNPSEGELKALGANSVLPSLLLSEEVPVTILSGRVEADHETTETGKSCCGEEDDIWKKTGWEEAKDRGLQPWVIWLVDHYWSDHWIFRSVNINFLQQIKLYGTSNTLSRQDKKLTIRSYWRIVTIYLFFNQTLQYFQQKTVLESCGRIFINPRICLEEWWVTSDSRSSTTALTDLLIVRIKIMMQYIWVILNAVQCSECGWTVGGSFVLFYIQKTKSPRKKIRKKVS